MVKVNFLDDMKMLQYLNFFYKEIWLCPGQAQGTKDEIDFVYTYPNGWREELLCGRLNLTSGNSLPLDQTPYILYFSGTSCLLVKYLSLKKWYYAVLHRSHPRPDGNLAHRGIKVVRRILKTSRESSSSVKRSAAKFEHLKCK